MVFKHAIRTVLSASLLAAGLATAAIGPAFVDRSNVAAVKASYGA